MKKQVPYILPAIVFAAARLGTADNPKKLATAPPMGWNSCDCYGTTVTVDGR